MSDKITWQQTALLGPVVRALNETTAEARRLSTMVDRLERESLELLEALGLHEDTDHADVLEHVRTLVREHGEMRMVVEGHRHRFRKYPGHHPKCDIPKSCQGGCWDLHYEDRS